MKISKPVPITLVSTNVTDSTQNIHSALNFGDIFQKDNKIYFADELINTQITPNKFFEKGSLATKWNGSDYEVWRKITNKDRIPFESLEFLVKRDNLPIDRLDPAPDGGYKRTIIKEWIFAGGSQPDSLRYDEYNYGADGVFINSTLKNYYMQTYDNNNLASINYIDRDNIGSYIIGDCVLIDGNYYRIKANTLGGTTNEYWEQVFNDDGTPARPYIYMYDSNPYKPFDTDLLSKAEFPNMTYTIQVNECFDVLGILKADFESVNVKLKDAGGTVVFEETRTLADEELVSIAEATCPDCDAIEFDCKPKYDQDLIFNFGRFDGRTIEITFNGDAKIGSFFTGLTYNLEECLLWGVQVGAVSTSFMETSKTGKVTINKGVSKRVITFPLSIETGLIDKHVRFFNSILNDLVLIQGTSKDASNGAYFQTLTLFCQFLNSPITLNRGKSSLSIKVQEVLKYG